MIRPFAEESSNPEFVIRLPYQAVTRPGYERSVVKHSFVLLLCPYGPNSYDQWLNRSSFKPKRLSGFQLLLEILGNNPVFLILQPFHLANAVKLRNDGLYQHAIATDQVTGQP